MKTFKNHKKVAYVISCLVIGLFLYGCKEKGSDVSVLDNLPESTFLTEAKTSIEDHVPVIVAFTAEWCPHCRKYKPVFSEVKDMYKGKVTFINVDVDDKSGSALSDRFQVRGIPTTAFVRADGSVLEVKVGEVEREKLIEFSDLLIANKKRKKGDPIAPFPIDLNKKEEVKPAETLPEPKEEKSEEVKPEGVKPAVDAPPEEEFKEDIPIPEGEEPSLPSNVDTNNFIPPPPTPPSEEAVPESKDGSTGSLDEASAESDDESDSEEND